MLSIDVGSKKVCVVEGSYQNGKVNIASCGEIEYKSEVTVNGLITDRATLSFLINEIIKTKLMKSKNVVFTFNSSDIISRDFKLPDIKHQSLQLLVKNEMSRIVGSENDFIIDYITTGVTTDKQLSITAFAVSKDIVGGYFSILKELKLTPVALDIHSNCISKLLTNATINQSSIGDGNIILADIGYSKISFHGFSNGASRFNRTETSPVQEFMREISNIHRVDATYQDMAALDFSPDFVFEDPVLGDICKYFISRIADEIQRYIQYTLINSTSKTVMQVYLCGGVSSIKGMDIAISNILKIPVETLKTVERINTTQDCSLSKLCNAAGALIRL